ncbi:MAG: hypothetical protein HY088_05320 [Ignavibacteriales bacterium]|nr:hypothetical protein [Ignavibacteriales bacterium]
MLRLLFRFLLWAFAFYFVYKLIKNVYRTLIGEPKKPAQPSQEPEAPEQDDSKYGDVKDAIFKDVPKDSPQK